jgi:hypothetical protein
MMIGHATGTGGCASLLLAAGLIGACGVSTEPTRKVPEPSSGRNAPPSISGAASVMAVVGAQYEFAPRAVDPEGKRLTFSIRNRPTWLAFDPASGRLSGRPGKTDAGLYSGIAISVSDNVSRTVLPEFAVLVSATASGATTVRWSKPAGNLRGFRVHYGVTPSVLTQTLDVPDPAATSAIIDRLGKGVWYFGVVAYSGDGVESVMTDIVNTTVR